MTNEGYGRIELQSDAGDVQIVWSPSQVSVLTRRRTRFTS